MMPFCNKHGLAAQWKTGNKNGVPYAFWGCPGKDIDATGKQTFCKTKWPDAQAPAEQFEQSLQQSDSMNEQREKEKRITRTALAKSYIEAGKVWCEETTRDLERWLTFIENGKI